MLPNPEDAPETLAKQSRDFLVADFVSGNLRRPKTFPRFWHPAVPPAAVPKASIYEDSQTFLAKHEIGLTGQVLIATPAGNAIHPEDRNEFKFGGPIAA
jgi:hypothetical protein